MDRNTMRFKLALILFFAIFLVSTASAQYESDNFDNVTLTFLGGYESDNFDNVSIVFGEDEVSKEPGFPNVTLNSPVDDFNSSVKSLTFNFTASDNKKLENVSLWGNWTGSWKINETNSSGINDTEYVFDKTIPNGKYKWGASATDNESQTTYSENRTFLVDTTIPNITFVPKTEKNNSFVQEEYVYMNVSYNDSSFKNITYYLYNSSGLQDKKTYTTTTFENNFTGLNDGEYWYNVTAYDVLNRSEETETRKITLDNQEPTTSYNPSTDNDGDFVPRDSILVNMSATDSNLDAVQMEFDGVNETFNTNIADNYWENKTSLSEGSHQFYGWANDSAGNTNTLPERNVTVDTIDPTINYEDPTEPNEAYQSSTTIEINVSVSDSNLNATKFRLFNATDGSTVATDTFTDGTSDINYVVFNEGKYGYNVTATDLANNSATTNTRNLTVDTTNPSASFVSPTTSAGDQAQEYIEANVSVTESNLDNVTINLYNSTGLAQSESSTNNNFFFNFTNLEEGTYDLNSTAYDLAGNTDTTNTRTINLDNENPDIKFVDPTPSAGSIEGTSIPANVTASDANLDTINLTLYNSSSLVSSTSSGTSPLFNNFTGLSSGDYHLNATANDTFGNVNNTETRDISLLVLDDFNITLNSNISFVFNPNNQSHKGVAPGGQNDSHGTFVANNNLSNNIDIYGTLNESYQGSGDIDLKIGNSSNYSQSTEITTSNIKVYNNLTTGNTTELWTWADYDNALQTWTPEINMRANQL